MEKRKALLALKEEIKKCAAESRAVNPKIRAAKGLDRYHLHQEKAQIGCMTRYLLLAYALLRYRPYRQQEPRATHKPWVIPIFDTANRFGNIHPKSVIEAWLEGAELPAMIVTEPQLEATA